MGEHKLVDLVILYGKATKGMERLLKVEQVADLFQVSKRTIYDWVHVDYIPHYKFPKGVRFKPSEVEHWLQRRMKRGRENYQVGKIL